MIKIYTKAIILFLLSFNIKANAQCTGCTTNITGLDAAPHIVTSGQIFCIAPTGTVTGQITVSAGGTLCNQGTINSFALWIAGGTLKNYGTLNINNVQISTAGTYTNFATSIIDSLLITGTSSTYINKGTQNSQAFAIVDYAIAVNTGTITAIIMADSIGNFNNNGNLNITNGFINEYNSVFLNNGNVTITNDFSNAYSSNFTNNSYMNVMRDFFNSYNSNFTTKCMINVGRDWYNAANVYGPTTGCGGFNITGVSYSSGLIGSASTHIDLCDAGHPALGIDGPGGTIINTTTYCTCTNACTFVVTGIKEVVAQSNVFIGSIFPNPSSSKITVKLNNKDSESLLFDVRDMMGKVVFSKSFQTPIGETETDINVSNLTQGTYILTVTDSHQLQTKRLFSVYK